jgi:hypothetical protein
VPTELADKFAVKEEAVAPVPAPASETKETPPVKPAKARKTKEKKKKLSSAAPAKKFEFENRWPITPNIHAGERYVFDITYFGATAGELELEILPPKTVAERLSYHIRAIARTTSVFSLFYRMNDGAESFMDSQALISHKFSLKLDESLQQRDVLELYDQRARKVYYFSKLDHKKKGKKNDQLEITTEPYTQDGLSAFFFVRTLPLEMGKTYKFPVVNNGKLREVRITAVRKEKLKTKIGEFNTIVVKPEVVLDGVLRTYGDSFVWISDDPERRILKVDAKIKVGSVIAYLREYRSGQAAQPTAAADAAR